MKVVSQKLHQAIGLARAKGVSGKKIAMALSGFGLSMGSVVAFAAGPDFTPLTGSVDYTTLITAVFAVALLAVGYVIAKQGAAGLVRFIGRMAGS